MSTTTARRRYYAAAEKLDRGQLEAYQLRKLRRLLEYNYECNAFYREKWKRSGVRPEDIRTLDDFRHKVPWIEKQDCLADQSEHPPLGRRVGVSFSRIRQLHLTSGTSGIGQEAWGLTQSDIELSATAWVTQYRWIGLEPGDVAFYSIPVAFFANGLASEAAARKMGLVALNLFGMDKNLVDHLIDRFQPHYLFGMLTIPASGGAPSAPSPHDRVHRLKGLSTAMLSGDGLRRMNRAWGAPVFEVYGCTQASSVVGATCEQTSLVNDEPGIVHFLENHYIVECLDRETGNPAEAGEDCEIFLTTLDREASPAIRFRMHDKAEFLPADTCACGRPYHGYRAGTVGRWDDMMKIKGINVWPSTMDEIVMMHPEVAEYRGFVEVDKTKGRESLRVVVDFKPGVDDLGPARSHLLETLRDEIKAKTFLNAVVEESDDPLPAFAFKPARWTDSRKEPTG